MQPDFKNSHIEERFLTRSGEKMFFTGRGHVLLLLPSILTTLFLDCLLIVLFIIIEKFFTFSLILFAGVFLALFLFTVTVVMKLIVDWYFHIYIITNYKIIEVCYRPFFFKDITIVPLDQIRCIEINSKTQGFIKTLYDFGDIIIKLDLLTHQDTFIMTGVASPQRTGLMLSDIFNTIIATRGGGATITPLPVAYIDNNHPEPIYPQPQIIFPNQIMGTRGGE